MDFENMTIKDFLAFQSEVGQLKKLSATLNDLRLLTANAAPSGLDYGSVISKIQEGIYATASGLIENKVGEISIKAETAPEIRKYLPKKGVLQHLSPDQPIVLEKNREEELVYAALFHHSGSLKFIFIGKLTTESPADDLLVEWLKNYFALLNPFMLEKGESAINPADLAQAPVEEAEESDYLQEWKERLMVAFNTINRLEKKLETTKDELQKAKNVEKSDQKLAENYYKQLEENQLRIKSLERKLEEANANQSGVSVELSNEEAESQLKDLSEKVNQLQREMDEKDLRIHSLQEKAKSADAGSEKELESLRTELKKQQLAYDQLKKESNSKARRSGKTAFDAESFKEEIRELKKTIQEKNKEIRSAKSEGQKEKRQVEKELKLQLSQEQKKVKKLESDLSTAENTINDFKKQIADFEFQENDFKTLKNNLEEKTIQHQSLQSTISEKSAEIEELKTKISEFSEILVTNKTLSAKVEELGRQNEELQSEEKQLNGQLDELKKELLIKEESIASLLEKTNKLSELEIRLNEKKEVHFQLQQENEQLEKQVAALQSELQEAEHLKKELFEKEKELSILSERTRDIEALKKRFEGLESASKNYKLQVDELGKQLEDAVFKLKSLEEQLRSKESELMKVKDEWYQFHEENSRDKKILGMQLDATKKEKARLEDEINKLDYEKQQAFRKLSSIRELEASLDAANRMINEQNSKLSQAEFALQEMRRKQSFNHQFYS